MCLFWIHNKRLWSGVKAVQVVLASIALSSANQNASPSDVVNVRGASNGLHPESLDARPPWRGLKMSTERANKSTGASWQDEQLTRLEFEPWVLIYHLSLRPSLLSHSQASHTISCSTRGREVEGQQRWKHSFPVCPRKYARLWKPSNVKTRTKFHG